MNASTKPERLATTRVVSDATPQGYVIINASDFDANVHEKHESDPGDTGEDLSDASSMATDSASGDVDSGLEFPNERRVSTMRIVSDETAAGYMIINTDDFDPTSHVAYDNATRAAGDVDVADLASLSFPALRQAAKKLGLKASGTRADLETAILEHVTDPAIAVADHLADHVADARVDPAAVLTGTEA